MDTNQIEITKYFFNFVNKNFNAVNCNCIDLIRSQSQKLKKKKKSKLLNKFPTNTYRLNIVKIYWCGLIILSGKENDVRS